MAHDIIDLRDVSKSFRSADGHARLAVVSLPTKLLVLWRPF